LYVCHHHQNICRDDGDQPEQAKALLPEFPELSIFHALEEKLPEWVDRRLAGKAIINVLVILIRFEPELIRVAKEQQAEKQKDEDKT
jgi:hypothetical protein